jgi:hypothetical protein
MRIYLDEVRRIVEILRDNTHHVNISTDDFVFVPEELDQLKQLGVERIRSLDIESEDPRIWLSLAPGTAMIQSSSPSPAARGLIAEIEAVLHPCRRRYWQWVPRKKTDRAGREQVMNYSTVVLKDRAEATGFFKRKKDDILLLLIGAIFGAIFGAAVTAVIALLVK